MVRKRANFLFFLSDHHRWDWLEFNSTLPLRTPNLKRLKENGVNFSNTFTPSPLCAPARACLASGLHYDKCGVANNNGSFPLSIPTYYQKLRDAGYRVCGVGKFDLHKDSDKPPAELDWDLDGSRMLKEWGFTEGIDNEGKVDGVNAYRSAGRPKGPYLNFLFQRGLADVHVKEQTSSFSNHGVYVTSLPDDAYCDNWIADNGLRFLQEFPENQPWFLIVNFAGPHPPYDVTQSMYESWKEVSFPLPVENTQKEFSFQDHQHIRRHFAAMIENIDRQIGRFIDVLEKRGESDHTVIIYSSDHGEMLGDHNLWGKIVFYDPSVRVPLIISYPDIKKNITLDSLVNLHDITATILDFAKLEPLPDMEAKSLKNLLYGKTTVHRQEVWSALNEWRMTFDGRYKHVTIGKKQHFYFDMRNDPLELHPIPEDK